MLTSKLRSFLSFCFPVKCVICEKTSNQPYELCTQCEEELAKLKLDANCFSQYHRFARGYSFFTYNAKIRKLLHAFKFHQQFNLKFFLAELCYPHLLEYANAGYCLVAAPTSKRNGAFLAFLKTIQQHYRLKIIRPFTKRKAVEQKTLSRVERFSLIKDNIMLTKRALKAVTSTKILLIDDIITTGATLMTCQELLLKNCAIKEVAILTFALVLP